MRSSQAAASRPRSTFAGAFNPRNNAFGFLRLTLAVLVIFSHSFSLGGFGTDPLVASTRGRYSIRLASVGMFFVLSGFLICRSAVTCSSVGRFLWHRFLRIFPGYWICLAVCACAFGPLIAFGELWTLTRVFSLPVNSPQALMIHNAGLFHFRELSVPGIFNISPAGIGGLLLKNPVPEVLNGALWTLPYEFACYLGVALLALVRVLRRVRFIVVILFAASF